MTLVVFIGLQSYKQIYNRGRRGRPTRGYYLPPTNLYGLIVRGASNQVNGASYTPESSIMRSSSDSVWSEHTINCINQNANYIYLLQNYPNPFNDRTNICLEVKQSTEVNIDIYNLLGQKELNLFSGFLETGLQCYDWGGAEVTSGLYFVIVSVADQNLCKKMILVK